ncbi:hypothetical protein [Pseudohongiella sp. O18]|uniref:hypothetical protein n=1 Tax=Pseudohongiella sp. O18 TaxID=2904248 RepID=UPI001F3C2232|nr:hypothetical protein [Pseudohongiella sp. O18]
MSKFEFIMMFVSVVVAFAMAELLMGWGKLIRARRRVTRPGLLAGWSVWLLFIMTYHYMGFWEYQAYNFTKVTPMLLFLAAPIMMVLLTFVLTPEIRFNQSIDLEKHYFETKNWFFIMVIIFLILARASDPLLPDYADTWLRRMTGTILVSASVILLLFTDNRQIHYILMWFNLAYLTLVSSIIPVSGLTAF